MLDLNQVVAQLTILLIKLKDYFTYNGELTEDKQREGVYTRKLANKIAEKFHTANTVLTSHLIAFTAFEMIKNENKMLPNK